MTAGTKIFLAIVAVLVAVLVVYYGFLMEDSAAPLVMDEPEQPAAVIEEPQNIAPAPESHVEPREERPRILGTPREEAEPEPEPDSEQAELEREVDPPPDEETERAAKDDAAELEDHSPVVVSDDPVLNGGKDAPPDAARAEDDSEEDVEPASESEEQQRRDVPEPPQYTEYTVRPGDTMSSIAAEWFGDAAKWDLIAKENPFVDPNRLTVGRVLRLPPKDAEREAVEGRSGDDATIYVVRSGDNLSRIARAYYNDAGLWRLIYDANRRTIGDDPGRLRVGLRLTIPPAPKPADESDDE